MPPNGTESAAGGDSRPVLPITHSSQSHNRGRPSLSPSQVERGLSGSPRSNGYYGTTPRIQLFGSVPEGDTADQTDTEDEGGPSEGSRLLPNSVSISSASPRKSPKRHYSLSGYAATADGKAVAIEGEVNAKEVANGGGCGGTSGDSVADDEHSDGLRKRTQSVLQITGLIDDQSKRYEHFRKSDQDLKAMTTKVRDFYQEQNAILDGFAEVDEILTNTTVLAATGELAPALPVLSDDATDKRDAAASKVKVYVNVNFLLNCVLLAGKILVVITSSSMSMVASAVDSAMDWLSTAIIFYTGRVIEHRDWISSYQYPTGKKRLEPVSIVIFSVAMIASFLQVFLESAKRLFEKDLQTASIPLSGKIVMLITIAAKGACWAWGRGSANTSVQALAQDAENDVVFNVFSLLFPLAGELLHWRYLDPLGGCLLSLYIIYEWMHTLLDNTRKLAGKRASPAEHQRVAYLLTRFSPLVKCIQHLSVYHSGDAFVVECDVVLPSSTTLTQGHNLGESIQYAIEQLEGVERAYVHVDVTVNPLSGHLER